MTSLHQEALKLRITHQRASIIDRRMTLSDQLMICSGYSV
jgi:hypothetical protein